MASNDATSTLAATFGRNLRRARLEAGYTQHSFAVALGRGDAMTISRWERGEHKPSDENIILVAQLLGRDPGWFFNEHNGDPEPTEAAA